MALAAYPLSKADFPFKKPVLIFFIITMLFSSGIISIYLLMSSMHLTENIGGIIIISLSNVFNMLLFKTTFEGIPKELEESALIDGASSIQMFFRIIIPITLPTFASCCFFTLVGCINGYSGALLFIRTNHEAKPMALIMYELLAVAGKTQTDSYLISNLFNIQSAGIILTVIPILVIYPYIIKYIKSGITLGSVKG
jgi:putative aldouronate transport system permease protein